MFIPTISGAPFIKVSDAKLDFIATLFLGVSGKQAKDPSDFTPEMFKKWGHYIGQLQEKSRLFQSTVKDFNRKSWSQDSLYLMVEDEIQTEVGYIFEVFTELKKKLLYLEKDPLSYGLIHADLHHGNFFLDQNTNLTAIDFDDACISWYAYDLAVAEFSLDHFFFDQNIHLGFDYKPIFYGGFLSAKNDSSRSVLKSVPLFLLYRSIMMNLWCKKRIREEKDCAAIRRWCSSCRDWTQTKILETSKKIMV